MSPFVFCSRFFGVSLIAALLAGPTARPAQAQTYTLTDLGPTGDGFAIGVNNSGQVSGFTEPSGTSNGQAFFFEPGNGVFHSLGLLPGGAATFGYFVNDSGQVAGFGSIRNIGSHAFLSGPNGGPLKDLGTLPSGSNSAPLSFGVGVNASGQVSGYSEMVTPQSPTTLINHAFLSGPNGGPLRDLGAFHQLNDGPDSYGFGVNASGEVAGYADTVYSEALNDYLSHAFLSGPNGGPLKDLGTLAGLNYGPDSEGIGVNAAGQVAGYADAAYSQTAGGYLTRAFLSGPNGGALKDLGTLPGGSNSMGIGVNDQGQVVGQADIADGEEHAFLYSNNVMVDLNSLVSHSSGLLLTEAISISNTGFITGAATLDGQMHGFLLTPVTAVNTGPKLVVTATASARDASGNVVITIKTANLGMAAADTLQINQVTFNGGFPAAAPISPSPVPTTPDLLPPGQSQLNGFQFTVPPGTTHGAFKLSGTYVDTSTGKTGSFSATVRSLAIP